MIIDLARNMLLSIIATGLSKQNSANILAADARLRLTSGFHRTSATTAHREPRNITVRTRPSSPCVHIASTRMLCLYGSPCPRRRSIDDIIWRKNKLRFEAPLDTGMMPSRKRVFDG
jgi:hypothetical protein